MRNNNRTTTHSVNESLAQLSTGSQNPLSSPGVQITVPFTCLLLFRAAGHNPLKEVVWEFIWLVVTMAAQPLCEPVYEGMSNLQPSKEISERTNLNLRLTPYFNSSGLKSTTCLSSACENRFPLGRETLPSILLHVTQPPRSYSNVSSNISIIIII